MPPGNRVLSPSDSPHLNLVRPDDTPVTFSCSGKQGALLSLPFPADHEETNALGDFSKWIIKNIDDCLKVANDLGCGVNMEDIILVTGRRLARSWISVVFSEIRGHGDAQVSFVVRVSGDSCVHHEERNASGGVLKFGPRGEVGFHTILSLEPILRNFCPDTPHARIYQRTNAFLFKGFVSSAS